MCQTIGCQKTNNADRNAPELPPGDTRTPGVLRQDDTAHGVLVVLLRAVPPVCALDRQRGPVLPALTKPVLCQSRHEM